MTWAEDVKAALDQTVETFGRLDVAFNNAGIEQETKPAAEITDGSMGTPEEIAAAVIWLCSDAASFVVGHAVVVDGGKTTGR